MSAVLQAQPQPARPPAPARQDALLTPEARAFLADLHRRHEGERQAGSAPRGPPAGLRCRRAARLPPATPRDPSRWLGRRRSGRAGSPRRNHRAGRPEDGHQCAELRRQLLHGRFRGTAPADLDKPRLTGQQALRAASPAPGSPPRRRRRARQATRCVLRPSGGADRAPARLAPGREARRGWMASGCRPRCSTSACSPSTTPACWPRATAAPYFYPPKLQSMERPRCGRGDGRHRGPPGPAAGR